MENLMKYRPFILVLQDSKYSKLGKDLFCMNSSEESIITG